MGEETRTLRFETGAPTPRFAHYSTYVADCNSKEATGMADVVGPQALVATLFTAQ